MSNKVNHRRKHQKVRRECEKLRNWASNGGVQGASRGRRSWKRLRNRSIRRVGRWFGSFTRAVELDGE